MHAFRHWEHWLVDCLTISVGGPDTRAIRHRASDDHVGAGRAGDEMRSRLITSIAIALMIVPGVQPVRLAGAQDVAQSVPPAAPAGSTVSGSALRTDFKPLPAATVRLRQFEGNGAVLASARTGPSGEFAFSGVPAGNYLIELVDFSGKLVGMAPPFVVAGQGPVVVSVMASGLGVTAASAAGGGFSLFGLGPTASLAVLGAAGAAAVTAVVATQPDASPSR
jgi:hypothetical protein